MRAVGRCPWRGRKSLSQSFLVFGCVHVVSTADPSPWTATILRGFVNLQAAQRRGNTYSTVAVVGSCKQLIRFGFSRMLPGSGFSFVGILGVEASPWTFRSFIQRNIAPTALWTPSIDGFMKGDMAKATTMRVNDTANPHLELAEVTNQATTAPTVTVTKFLIDGWSVRREKKISISTPKGRYWLKSADISADSWRNRHTHGETRLSGQRALCSLKMKIAERREAVRNYLAWKPSELV